MFEENNEGKKIMEVFLTFYHESHPESGGVNLLKNFTFAAVPPKRVQMGGKNDLQKSWRHTIYGDYS